jgi:hypothetical protein
VCHKSFAYPEKNYAAKGKSESADIEEQHACERILNEALSFHQRHRPTTSFQVA